MYNEKEIANIRPTAIRSLNPDAEFTIDADGTVHFINTFIPNADIIAQEQAILNEWNATEYIRLRQVEYAKLNQDEMRYNDIKNGTTTWVDAIDAIKALYPKPA